MSFDIGDTKRFAGGIHRERPRKPTNRNQAEQFRRAVARGKANDSDAILSAVGDVKSFAVGCEGQGVGGGAEEVSGTLLYPDRFDDGLAASINDGKIVGGGIGANKISAIRRKGESGRMELRRYFSDRGLA